jgi:hypothetical protein
MSDPGQAVDPDELMDVHVDLGNQTGGLRPILELATTLRATLYDLRVLDEGGLLLTTTTSSAPQLVTTLSQRGYDSHPSPHVNTD